MCKFTTVGIRVFFASKLLVNQGLLPDKSFFKVPPRLYFSVRASGRAKELLAEVKIRVRLGRVGRTIYLGNTLMTWTVISRAGH